MYTQKHVLTSTRTIITKKEKKPKHIHPDFYIQMANSVIMPACIPRIFIAHNIGNNVCMVDVVTYEHLYSIYDNEMNNFNNKLSSIFFFI